MRQRLSGAASIYDRNASRSHLRPRYRKLGMQAEIGLSSHYRIGNHSISGARSLAAASSCTRCAEKSPLRPRVYTLHLHGQVNPDCELMRLLCRRKSLPMELAVTRDRVSMRLFYTRYAVLSHCGLRVDALTMESEVPSDCKTIHPPCSPRSLDTYYIQRTSVFRGDGVELSRKGRRPEKERSLAAGRSACRNVESRRSEKKGVSGRRDEPRETWSVEAAKRDSVSTGPEDGGVWRRREEPTET